MKNVLCFLLGLFICFLIFNIQYICFELYKENNECKENGVHEDNYIEQGSVDREKTIDVNEWITIPTYDRSNESTHPKVLYFDEPVNGYKYWLVSTPYPNNTAFYENPSIVVSNDGIHFIEPEGLKNPISGYPSSYWDNSYYSDPFLLYDDDHFELFYRKTLSYHNGVYKNNGFNYIYMRTSNNGIDWSEEKLVLDNDPDEAYMSISVVKKGKIYKIWYVNYDNKVKYVSSFNLEEFSDPIDVTFNNFGKKIWHGEMQYINNKFVYIFMIKYKLFYSESTDGLIFSTPKLINTDLKELYGVSNNIYKSTYIINDNNIELYIPYRVYSDYAGRHIWKMRHIKTEINKFNSSLK